MSLLFDRPLSVKTCFTVKTDGNKKGHDTVLIGKELWDILAPTASTGRVSLSIQPLRKTFGSTQTTLGALTCWAVLDDEVRNICRSILEARSG